MPEAQRRTAGALAGQRARRWTERLLTRTTSGAIYAIVVLICLYMGPIITTLMIGAWGGSAAQFFRIARMGGRMPNGVGLPLRYCSPLAAYGYGLGALSSFVLAPLPPARHGTYSPRANVGDVYITVFGPLYVAHLLEHSACPRGRPRGSLAQPLTFGVMLSSGQTMPWLRHRLEVRRDP